jgi:UDP-N-acetylmuramoyl-L-alanyl-D-glutamate--2,6-diaminopimelate ligase
MKSDAITLQDIVRHLPEVRSISGASVSVSGVAHDSRDVRSGDMFVCLVGSSFDGHRFVADAVRKGAEALLVQSDRFDYISSDIPHIAVDDTRSALPLVASCVYGRPSRKLKLFGVTGTNGKTTTTLLLERILRQRGWKTGVIGTLGSSFMGDPIPSEHTTPEANQLQFLLREMLLRGGDAVVMEVSSHAIAMKRTLACEYDGAAFTNLTQDHLDFHSTMEEYFQTKLRLFAQYPLDSAKTFHASVNMDDPYGKRILSETKGDVVTYSVSNDAILTAQDIHYAPHQTRFILRSPA